jgi:pimeloyl-ACP methyl ester carboxylesterase
VRAVEIEDVGHMGPVTHPDAVNALIDEFLGETAPRPCART